MVYFKLTPLGTLAALIALASAAATVKNACGETVYISSWENGDNGSNPGPIIAIAVGGVYV